MNTNDLRKLLAEINGDLIGASLLDELKTAFISDPVLASIFGDEGQRIFVNEKPDSYNDKLTPILEMWWDRERWQGSDTVIDGEIGGRLILPRQVQGKLSVQKMLINAITRFMGTERFYEIFDNVPGLTKIGSGINIQLNKLIKIGQFTAPTILFQLPFTFDIHLYHQSKPEVDFTDYLNSEPVEDFFSYIMNVEVDDNSEFTQWGDNLKNDNNGA